MKVIPTLHDNYPLEDNLLPFISDKLEICMTGDDLTASLHRVDDLMRFIKGKTTLQSLVLQLPEHLSYVEMHCKKESERELKEFFRRVNYLSKTYHLDVGVLFMCGFPLADMQDTKYYLRQALDKYCNKDVYVLLKQALPIKSGGLFLRPVSTQLLHALVHPKLRCCFDTDLSQACTIDLGVSISTEEVSRTHWVHLPAKALEPQSALQAMQYLTAYRLDGVAGGVALPVRPSLDSTRRLMSIYAAM